MDPRVREDDKVGEESLLYVSPVIPCQFVAVAACGSLSYSELALFGNFLFSLISSSLISVLSRSVLLYSERSPNQLRFCCENVGGKYNNCTTI